MCVLDILDLLRNLKPHAHYFCCVILSNALIHADSLHRETLPVQFYNMDNVEIACSTSAPVQFQRTAMTFGLTLKSCLSTQYEVAASSDTHNSKDYKRSSPLIKFLTPIYT